MNTDELQLAQYLKEQGYSLTKPRLTIFNALSGHEAQTMATLSKSCRGKIDRASMYRTIALFEKLGIVQRLQIGWKYKLELTDRFSHHHHHMTCLRCGATTSLSEDTFLEQRLHELAAAQNFQPTDHQIEIRGLCSSCQAG